MSTRRFALSIACCTLLSLVGCSSDEPYTGPELIPVAGVVTFDQEPLADATLTFVPTGDTRGQGAIGQTDTNGRFTLKCFAGLGGAPAGAYRVIITKRVTPTGDSPPPTAEVGPMDSAARQILPACYSSFQHSKLTASVTEDTPLEFHLRSVVRHRW